MEQRYKLFALAATLMLAMSAFAPTAVAAAGAGNDAGNDGGNTALGVSVADAGNDGAVVTVTSGNAPVSGADVTVTALDNTYLGAGTYTTGNDGTVSLPEPTSTVQIEVTATHDGVSATTEFTLVVDDDQYKNFGQRVSAFVHKLMQSSAYDGPPGQVVSEYVTHNNPGHAPDHAGPKATDDSDENHGPPEHAGPKDKADKQNGPPEHAGPNKTTDSEDDDDDEESDDGNGNGHGKPDHAGGPDK